MFACSVLCFCLVASLCFRCFWCVQYLFVKKNKVVKTALITSFTLLLLSGSEFESSCSQKTLYFPHCIYLSVASSNYCSKFNFILLSIFLFFEILKCIYALSSLNKCTRETNLDKLDSPLKIWNTS